MDKQQPQPISWKRLSLFAALFVGLTLAGFFTVFEHFSGRNLSFDGQLLKPGFVGACLLLLVIYFVADGLRFYYTLVALGVRVKPRVMAKLVFINIFFSNITPMATGGGFAQVWYLHQQGVSVGKAMAASTIRTVLAVLFIFSLAPWFLLTLEPLQRSSWNHGISSALAMFTLLYLAFFVILLWRAKWLVQPLTATVGLLNKVGAISETRMRAWNFRLMRELFKFSRSFSEYRHGSKWAIALSVIHTGVFLLALFSFPALLMWGLGYDVPYLTSLGLLVVTTFIMYFSPTPGASGISEGVFGSFFNQLLEQQHLLLVTFSWRALTIYLGMVIGLLVLQRYLLQRSQQALRANL